MPCPWYQHGLCTSPKLSKPTDAVVNPERCLGAYEGCSYYVKPEEKQGIEAFISRDKKFNPYPPIHALEEPLNCGCENFKLINVEGVLCAYCRVLDRLLTRSEARTCSKYWRTCPLRKP